MPKFNIKLLSEETAPTPAQEEQFFVNIDPIDNDSKTSEIYEARKKYKEQVNDKNLPIGNKAEYSRAIRKQMKKLKELQEEYENLLKFFETYPNGNTEDFVKIADGDLTRLNEAEILWNNNLSRVDDLKRNKLITAPGGQKFKIKDEFEGIIPDLEASIENLKSKNEKDISLRNQLDTWYEDPSYGRLDYKGRAILSTPNRLTKVSDTDFRLQDFAAIAAENFLRQYNVERPTHPASILNNLKIKKAYVPIASYEEFLDNLYVSFFNDVLDQIKNTNKIKNIKDFINIFYNWFLDQDVPVSSVGFLKSGAVDIYNTGLAFDFFVIKNAQDKEKVLNDVRFPVLNYVAKINGLKIDPNYPSRLVADINSLEMLQYAKTLQDFNDVPLEDIPKKIFSFPDGGFKIRFNTINFSPISVSTLESGFGLKNTRIYSLISTMEILYNRFTKKYPFYINYKKAEQFKEKFDTSKIPREKTNDQTFLNPKKAGGGNFDIAPFFIDLYIKIRAKEEDVTLLRAEVEYLRKQMNILASSAKIPSFFPGQYSNYLVDQLRLTVTQPINYLELYLKSKKDPDNFTEKRNFIFSWSRANA